MDSFDEWALSFEFIYDNYDSEAGQFSSVPTKIRSWSTPLSLRYFHPSGVFAVLGGSYVFQEVNRAGNVQRDGFNFEGNSNFSLNGNAAVGYRFPARRGIISIQALERSQPRVQVSGQQLPGVDKRPSGRSLCPGTDHNWAGNGKLLTYRMAKERDYG